MNIQLLGLTIIAFASVALARSPIQSPPAPTKRALAQLTPPVVFHLPLAPTSSGSDDCANAAANDAISGTGMFPVDTTTATDGGTMAPFCQSMHKDVWFQYTAQGTGVVTIACCGTTTSDTVISVWGGAGCPIGFNIACADDQCGVVSQVSFPVSTGNVYMLQVGMYGVIPGTAFAMNITFSAPPSNDSCSTPTLLLGPGTYAYDATAATAGSEGQTNTACALPGSTLIVQDLWYTFSSTVNGTGVVTTCGLIDSANADTRIAIYDGAGCPAGNGIACQDDIGPACTQSAGESRVAWPIVCGQVYTLQLGQNPQNTVGVFGRFDVSVSGTACSPFTPYCFGTAGACPCGNGGAMGNGCASSVNSSGANLAGNGNASIANDTFVLSGAGMPDSFALYFQGTTQTAGGIGSVFGDGVRCASGSIVRLGSKLNTGGASAYPSGSSVRISIKGANAAGNVRDYQCWYRNAAAFCSPATFNLTNGLQVTWIP